MKKAYPRHQEAFFIFYYFERAIILFPRHINDHLVVYIIAQMYNTSAIFLAIHSLYRYKVYGFVVKVSSLATGYRLLAIKMFHVKQGK